MSNKWWKEDAIVFVFIANGNPMKIKIKGWLIKSNVQELSADKQE